MNFIKMLKNTLNEAEYKKYYDVTDEDGTVWNVIRDYSPMLANGAIIDRYSFAKRNDHTGEEGISYWLDKKDNIVGKYDAVRKLTFIKAKN